MSVKLKNSGKTESAFFDGIFIWTREPYVVMLKFIIHIDYWWQQCSESLLQHNLLGQLGF